MNTFGKKTRFRVDSALNHPIEGSQVVQRYSGKSFNFC